MTADAPWLTLALLGAWHGLNPGMGWLFAVSRGLQEQRGAAVVGALAPLGLGHALAIASAFAVLAVGQASLSVERLRWLTAAVLIGFGLLKLVRHRHPRWVGMRVNFKDLTLWSFLMASAHGAGLMLLPLFIGGARLPACPAQADLTASDPRNYLAATLFHTLAMLLVTGSIALVVYYRLGLRLLRRAWFNLERAWSLALILSGIAALSVLRARSPLLATRREALLNLRIACGRARRAGAFS